MHTGTDSGLPAGSDTGDSGSVRDSADTLSDWTDECAGGPGELSVCRRTEHAGEGPYYLADVPERADTDLRGVDQQKMVIDLCIFELSDGVCRPFEGAVVDLWHCDETGVYDMSGTHHCRGRQISGSDGTVCFTAIRPPSYGEGADRLPAHFHINVLLEGTKVLTTQIWFEDDPVVITNPPPVPQLILPVETLSSGRQRVSANFVFDRAFPPPDDPMPVSRRR